MKRTGSLAAALAIAAGYALTRRRRRISRVAPELRHPMLYVPMSLRNDMSLRLGRRLPSPTSPIAEGVDVRDECVPGNAGQPDVRVIVYERRDRAQPSAALVWIHGGGLVMGTAESGSQLCSRFAAELGIVVISVEYRLAPEHPFPAGLDDCYTALCWARESADRLGIDRARIAVGGDSAGGGLAACLTQLALDRDGPSICFQLLQYPMLDDRTALRTDDDAIMWTNTSNRYSWAAYLGHRVSAIETRPYASAARRDDLVGLPPAWIGVGDIDLFHAESIDYANRLRGAGVSCDLHVVPGMYHGAEHFVPNAPSMHELLQRMTDALRSATRVRSAS
jgi:acetyl esterase/lipase